MADAEGLLRMRPAVRWTGDDLEPALAEQAGARGSQPGKVSLAGEFPESADGPLQFMTQRRQDRTWRVSL